MSISVTSDDFEPLLSNVCEDLDAVKYPVYASVKLDGIRAVIRNGVVVSRKLKPLRNRYVQHRLSHRAWADLLEGLDGELIVGDPCDKVNVFKNSSSGVMSSDGTPDFTFYVFDVVNDMTFADRHREVVVRCSDLMFAQFPVKSVSHKRIESADELRAYEKAAIEMGYEGVMIRDIDGPYKFGRSTAKQGVLQKIIRRQRTEATITGSVERMHNGNEATKDALGKTKRGKSKENLVGRGDLGALQCVDAEKNEVEIGTGFSDAERKALWDRRVELVGKTVTFEFRERTPDNSYRFPAFIGFRDQDDMS